MRHTFLKCFLNSNDTPPTHITISNIIYTQKEDTSNGSSSELMGSQKEAVSVVQATISAKPPAFGIYIYVHTQTVLYKKVVKRFVKSETTHGGKLVFVLRIKTEVDEFD
jgi:hypothetical protein